MSHNHNHHHHHDSRKNIGVAFLLNVSFTIIEIIGGLLTNSMAILSDALHDFGDSLSLGIAWILEGHSKKKPDSKFTFGYARFSLLGALINSIILVVGSIIILINALPRILNPQEVGYKGMLYLSIAGIVVNGLAVLRLKKGSSLNEKVVSWHLMEDVLGWVAVLIVSIVLMFTDLPVLDPILSVLITLYILYNVAKNLREILVVFLQGVPSHLSVNRINERLSRVEGVVEAHHTHLWSLDGESVILSTHIVIEDSADREEIVKIKTRIREMVSDMGIKHITMEVEFEKEKCSHQECG